MKKDLWYKIFKNYVESNKAINTLQKNGVVEEQGVTDMQVKLLRDIIITMQSELGE